MNSYQAYGGRFSYQFHDWVIDRTAAFSKRPKNRVYKRKIQRYSLYDGQ
jgi:hypothetical protein